MMLAVVSAFFFTHDMVIGPSFVPHFMGWFCFFILELRLFLTALLLILLATSHQAIYCRKIKR
jgi:hypothetical protein